VGGAEEEIKADENNHWFFLIRMVENCGQLFRLYQVGLLPDFISRPRATGCYPHQGKRPSQKDGGDNWSSG
jgi:hypothetical protein